MILKLQILLKKYLLLKEEEGKDIVIESEKDSINEENEKLEKFKKFLYLKKYKLCIFKY